MTTSEGYQSRQPNRPGRYTYIAGATTTLVQSGKGILKRICVNTPVASQTIKLYDGLTAVNLFATLTHAATAPAPYTQHFEAQFNTGLTVVTSGADDVTVVWE